MATANPDGAPSPQTRVEVLGNIGPNWFASVMGTGIVAIAGATLPVHVVALRAFAQVVWVIAAVLLVGLIVLVGGHWLRHPTVARTHARNPQMAHFYGAAPMALMTVGGGAVLVGRDLIGERVAVDLDWVLWTGGTLGGLFAAVSIPSHPPARVPGGRGHFVRRAPVHVAAGGSAHRARKSAWQPAQTAAEHHAGQSQEGTGVLNEGSHAF